MKNAGYAIQPGVFASEEIHALGVAIEAASLQRSRAGARHVLGCESIAACATDKRLIDIASQWLGASAIAFKATLFDKSPDANWLVAWHQDTALPMAARRESPGWGPWSEKAGVTYAHAPAHVLCRIVAIRVHLDDSTAENGSLRVLPETHSYGVMSDAQVYEISRRMTPVDCHAAAGGIVVMRPLIIHASSKVEASARRRVLHIEYCDSLEPEPGMRLQAA